MSTGLLPHRPPVEEPERGTRVATVGSGEAAAVCRLLSTETATDILAHLDASPAPASELARALDTSLQNVHYHLTRLEDAGLVRQVGTWLSERGTEMAVYAPAQERLVLATGDAGAGAAAASAEPPASGD